MPGDIDHESSVRICRVVVDAQGSIQRGRHVEQLIQSSEGIVQSSEGRGGDCDHQIVVIIIIIIIIVMSSSR